MAEVSLAAPPRDEDVRGRIPGEPGFWVVLFGEMGLFAILFTSYLVERGKDREAFAAGSTVLDLDVGVANTLILLASSLAVVVAVEGFRSMAKARALIGFVLAFVLGLGFVTLKAYEYAHLAEAGHGASGGAFYTWYFVLTGLHLVHLLIGLVVLVVLVNLTRQRLDPDRVRLVETGGCYWHLVDLLWIVIFPLVYLVA